MLGGIQLLRSYLGGGGVDQNAKACEQRGMGRGFVNANVYT